MVRHAPVIGKKGIIYGDDADIDLETTKEKIKALAQSLPGPDQAVWLTSGVDRAVKSALAVLKEMGCTNTTPEQHKGFREQNFGNLIGKKHEEITEHLNFIDGKIYAPAPPEGENLEKLISRLANSILQVKESAQKHKKEHIVIFCHGGAIRAANVAISKEGPERFLELNTPPLGAHLFDITDFLAT